MNSLTYSGTTLVLPDDLEWPDEYTWRPVEQRTSYSLAGSLIVESAAKAAGRSITLRGDEASAWVTRAAADQLAAWVAQAGITLSLVLRSGTPRNVIFDHANGPLTVTPIADYSDPIASDYCAVELRLLEV